MIPSGGRFRDPIQSSLAVSFVSAVEVSVQVEDQDYALQALAWEQW